MLNVLVLIAAFLAHSQPAPPAAPVETVVADRTPRPLPPTPDSITDFQALGNSGNVSNHLLITGFHWLESVDYAYTNSNIVCVECI